MSGFDQGFNSGFAVRNPVSMPYRGAPPAELRPVNVQAPEVTCEWRYPRSS